MPRPPAGSASTRLRTVSVPLPGRAYPILIGQNALDRAGRECRKLGLGRRSVIISDTNVAPLYAARVQTSLQVAGFESVLITVAPGETAKSMETVRACYDQLAEHRVERKSLVIAVGGGVVGDLAGFVAATYLRGIPFIQVPTTLLAQVDSSVGGKVGVNLRAGKNLVGAFYQPKLVLCDLDTLQSLPDREFRSGLAEVIKYGIIYDLALFTTLEERLDDLLRHDPALLAKVVARCCAIKAEVVVQDETEGGLRAILNFGHTIGHALEAISGYNKFQHGEAISIGQVAAARLSEKRAGLPRAEADRIEALFARAGLPVRTRLTGSQVERLLAAMRLDKKVSGGKVKFVLADRIGQVRGGHEVPESMIREVLLPT